MVTLGREHLTHICTDDARIQEGSVGLLEVLRDGDCLPIPPEWKLIRSQHRHTLNRMRASWFATTPSRRDAHMLQKPGQGQQHAPLPCILFRTVRRGYELSEAVSLHAEELKAKLDQRERLVHCGRRDVEVKEEASDVRTNRLEVATRCLETVANVSLLGVRGEERSSGMWISRDDVHPHDDVECLQVVLELQLSSNEKVRTMIPVRTRSSIACLPWRKASKGLK